MEFRVLVSVRPVLLLTIAESLARSWLLHDNDITGASNRSLPFLSLNLLSKDWSLAFIARFVARELLDLRLKSDLSDAGSYARS